jgi:hypothetical protein
VGFHLIAIYGPKWIMRAMDGDSASDAAVPCTRIETGGSVDDFT